jgi:hypothetical protein
VRKGYTAFNFETHTPTYLTKARILHAYCDFRDFITEDQFFGVMAATAIGNHAHRHRRTTLTDIRKEGSRAGYWGAPPATYEDVLRDVEGKTFFNCDHLAFGDTIRRFLSERFPSKSRFERD